MALEHSKFYTVTNPDIHVVTDHALIIGIVAKTHHEIDNTRIVKLNERISHYSLILSYTRGRDDHIADMLSRDPDDTMDAPELERNIDTVRRIRRVMMRSEAKGKKETCQEKCQKTIH